MIATRIGAVAAMVVAVPVLAALAPPRLTNPGAWLQKREAPAGTLKQGERAMTALDLSIAPDGSIATCDIALSSNIAALDRYACALFKQNARYEAVPKRDGEVVLRTRRDFWVWEAPKSTRDSSSKASAAIAGSDKGMWITTDDLSKAALAPDQVVQSNVVLTVSPGGRAVACHVTLPSERPDLDQHLCDLMSVRAHYKPAKDAAGSPIQGVDWVTIHWQVPKG